MNVPPTSNPSHSTLRGGRDPLVNRGGFPLNITGSFGLGGRKPAVRNSNATPPAAALRWLPIALGELIRTTSGAWITHPPTRCPNGHDFGAGRVLVGYQACLGHGGGHTTWTCRARDTRCTGQPLNTHCTALEGPAVVRISTTDTPLLLIAQIHLGVSPCLGPPFSEIPHPGRRIGDGPWRPPSSRQLKCG